jgi:hypothetical protein
MRRLLTTVTTAALVAGGTAGLAGPASAGTTHHSASRTQTVWIKGEASGMHFSTTWVHKGTVRFKISSMNPAGTNVVLFQRKPGVSFDKLDADLLDEFSQDPPTAAKGTRELVRDVRFFGLADALPGGPIAATVNLDAGLYYAFDASSPALPNTHNVVRLHVKGDGPSWVTSHRHLASVSLTSEDRFVVRGHLPAHGSVLVRNVADTIHFMEIQPVKAGTTDAEIQAFFESGSQDQPPFLLDGPGASMEVTSPGRQVVLSYSLPKGTYVLLCFIADDVTGMPHALMGMHKVVKVG